MAIQPPSFPQLPQKLNAFGTPGLPAFPAPPLAGNRPPLPPIGGPGALGQTAFLPGPGGVPLPFPLPPKDSFNPQASTLPQPFPPQFPAVPNSLNPIAQQLQAGGAPQPLSSNPAFPQQAPPQFPAAPGTDSFSPAGQQPPASGVPQQLGPTPGPEGAAGPEGFSDKNTGLANNDGFKLTSPVGLASSAVVLGLAAWGGHRIYNGKGIFGFFKTAAKEGAEAAKVEIKDLTNEFKTELQDAIKHVAEKQGDHLKPLTTGLTQESLETAEKAFEPHLNTIKDLKNKATLSEEQTTAHDALVEAIEKPLATAKETLNKNEKLANNFISEAKDKFKTAKTEFENKFGDDLKPSKAGEEGDSAAQNGTAAAGGDTAPPAQESPGWGTRIWNFASTPFTATKSRISSLIERAQKKNPVVVNPTEAEAAASKATSTPAVAEESTAGAATQSAEAATENASPQTEYVRVKRPPTTQQRYEAWKLSMQETMDDIGITDKATKVKRLFVGPKETWSDKLWYTVFPRPKSTWQKIKDGLFKSVPQFRTTRTTNVPGGWNF